MYQNEEWEVDRQLVEVGEEVGRGAFGKVCRGIYHHPKEGEIACAIKSVQERASHEDCLQFLLEAHTMT